MTHPPCYDGPLTDDEIAFVHQFVFEQLQLTPGPAHAWLTQHGLKAFDLRWFGIAMSKSGIQTPIDQMIDNPTTWKPVTPICTPWTDREEFLSRLSAIQYSLDESS